MVLTGFIGFGAGNPAPVSRRAGSITQVALHPSHPAVFPSSQDSPDSS